MNLVAIMWSLIQFFRFVESYTSAEKILIYSSNFIDVNIFNDLTFIISSMLPLLFLITFLGNITQDFVNNQGIYIFTRTSNVKKWMFRLIADIMIYIIIFVIMSEFITTIWCFIFKVEIHETENFATIFIQQITILSIYYFLSVLLVNTLSLFFQSTTSSLIVILINLFFVILASYLYKTNPGQVERIKWLPFTQGIYNWQVSMFNISSDFSLSINNFIFSLLYLTIMGIFLSLIYVYIFSRKDLY
ncbi:hypothetical protein [Paenibacillus bovis]|nr:hypothetical protein [Paenibacillus bovis]